MTVDASFATFLWHFYFIVVFSIKRKTKMQEGYANTYIQRKLTM